jgi:hypothetical protein
VDSPAGSLDLGPWVPGSWREESEPEKRGRVSVGKTRVHPRGWAREGSQQVIMTWQLQTQIQNTTVCTPSVTWICNPRSGFTGPNWAPRGELRNSAPHSSQYIQNHPQGSPDKPPLWRNGRSATHLFLGKDWALHPGSSPMETARKTPK